MAKEIRISKTQWEVNHAASEAVLAISVAAKEAAASLTQVAQDAARTLTQVAQDARSAVAKSAADAAQVLIAKQTDGGSDHDTLVTLVATVGNLDKNVAAGFATMRDDIKEVGTGMAIRMANIEATKLDIKDSYPVLYKADVEKRLADLTTATAALSTNMTRVYAYGSLALALVGVGVPVLLHFWK